MLRELKNAVLIFVALTVLTGVLYPLLITAAAQTFFKREANGSILHIDGKAVGSELIGQTFDDPKYFWGRLSATAPAYNAGASSGSNYGPLNAALKDSAVARALALKAADPANKDLIPVDLVTASGSGLDPQISPAAAFYQVPRIARLRGLSEEAVKEIVRKNTKDRFLGILGEPAVNVLRCNLMLDHPQLEFEKTRKDTLPKFMKWGG